MKIFTKSLPACLLVLTAALLVQRVSGQSILNPADTVYTYNSSATAGSSTNPNQPANGVIGKWIRTVRMSYSTTEWKCYIYEGMCFRLHFPLGYNPTANDGKLYPLMIFYHGAGEAGPITDNEESMAHGGQTPFQTASDAGTWPGYIIIPQNTNGAWDPTAITRLVGIIQYMITNNKLDPFHVTTNGLSAGGAASWVQLFNYPQYTQASLPMSSDDQSNASATNLALTKFTPVWTTQGGLDTWPDPGDAGIVNSNEIAAGADWTYTYYSTLGHDTWDSCWLMPNFWPFMNNAYASNPWPLHGQTAFCPGVTIVDTLGVAPGFDAYQWQYNGTALSATGNSIIAKQLGTYTCRVERGGIWSDWSHTPVVITIRQPTVTPPITIGGLQSFVIPSLSQSNVTLSLPTGYASYLWQKVGSNTTIGTSNTLNVTAAGQYIAEVTQTGGCSSNFSSPFTVAAAPGTNAPDPASGVTATPLSQTSVLVNWSQNPSPAHNEVNFEIYQATKPGGPWTLAAITPQDAFKDTITGLTSATQYYYEIRAVDSTGASATSNVASVSTIADTQPPTAPGTLTITGTSYNSVSLSWTASTDNVGVVAYDIYINGAKSYTLGANVTSFTVYSLVNGQNYQFVVKARDAAGNVSIPSNQVTGEALLNGIPYNYYNGISTTQSTVPNYNTMTTAFSGTLPVPGLSPQQDNTQFGFLFQGFINITTAGTYTFELTSDDGSNMWLGPLNGTSSPYVYGSTPTINDDGLHGSTTVKSKALTLQVGIYPIAIAYFNQTGGYALTLSWETPGSKSFVAVPASAFQQTAVVYGNAPNAPSNLKATALSYRAIQLNWTDNSTNETGFEIWRSNSPANTGAAIITTTAPGVTSYIDSTAAGGTQYFYEIRAVNQYGASNFTSNYTEAEFKFNNNYVDSTGNGHTITVVGSPTFDATTRAEGTYSVKLNGTNQALTLNNTNGWLQENYYQRTIATWVKASSTSGSNRVIWEIGGSTNGLSLVLNGTTLEACIASASSRKQVTTTMNNTNWNHIAVVYYGDTLQLYVNGVLAASNNSLGFHSIATTTDGARIGQTNGTNALNNNGGYFGGWIDDFGVYNTALSADVIQSIMNFTYHQSSATTGALPAVPTLPTNLTATALGASAVNVSWQDTATNVGTFQLYRSANNDQAYVLLATLPATAFSYKDSGLFANATYYYKVEATNVGGNSAFTPEISATTGDIAPVVNPIANQQARYGTTTVIPVSATVNGGGTITLTASGLPSFASFVDSGDAHGSITLNNPPQADSGTYTGLTVTATDAHGGTSSTKFNLWLNNNFTPTINAISNVTMNEGDSVAIALSGSDANPADTLTYVVTNVPTNYGSSYHITQNVSGTGSLVLKPGYASAGTYNVVVTLNDKNGLSAKTTFTLTVNYKNPNQTIYARIQAVSALGSPWNNMTSPNISNLLDVNGNTTNVGINLGTTFWDAQPLGPSTGNNSGVYPDAVLSQFWYFGLYGGPANPVMTISGLNPSLKYNVTLFAASNYSGVPNNGTTTYASGSQSVSLYVQGNTSNTVTLDTLTPTSGGTIAVTMGTLSPGSYPGYLNAVVIASNLQDGTSPAPPNSLQAMPGAKGVNLTWNNLAYNANTVNVYRATQNTSAFTLIATLPSTATSYVDSTESGNVLYYYTVDATNGVGASPFSDTASITTPDKAPVMTPISNVTMSNTQSVQVDVTATDDPTDHLTLTASNLPSFATFVDNGNGTGVVTITPPTGLQGTYNGITVTATDMADSIRSTSFNLNVIDTSITYSYLSFTVNPALNPAPWNSLLIPYIPYAGFYASNLLSQSGVNTGIQVTLTDAWDGMSTSGERRRNGSDLYPEPVSVYGMYTTNTNNHRITVTGLSTTKAYNFQFYSSYNTSQSELTHITINGDTVSMNGSHNSNKTWQINGITSDATGTVVINFQKDASAFAAVLNAMVIESYNPADSIVFSPGDLRKLDYSVTGTVKLQWQDRATNETGYEVWRAPDGGTYALLATLPPNSTGYTDSLLPASTTYDYTVRAVSGTKHSAFSNPIKGYTYDNTVFLFLNRTWQAGLTYVPANAPFNSLNWNYPSYPNTWNNFFDEHSLTTNIGLSQPDPFDEVDGGGASTGNNSGVFPDVALRQGWLNFEGDSSYAILTGLDVAKSYDITLLGSATDDNTGNASARYALTGGNGVQSGILNGHQNTNGVVTFFGIQPDQNGNIGIGLEAYDSANSSFGVLSDMVIKGYTPSTNTLTQPPVGTQQQATGLFTTGASFAQPVQDSVTTKPLSAYPNPFNQTFNLVVPATAGDNILVTITDVTGRTLFETTFNNLYQGDNVFQIKPNVTLVKGLYFVTVVYVNEGQRQVIKMLEQ
jgi:hypothetical protein